MITTLPMYVISIDNTMTGRSTMFATNSLDAAVQLADKLWQEMQRQWRIANPTAL